MRNLEKGKGGGGRWGERTHHEGIDKEVVVLERVEGGGGGGAVPVGLAHLQGHHHRSEPAEEQPVEGLHSPARFTSQRCRRREGTAKE